MKMLIPLLCLLSFTIAEPPLGDSYASARSSHGYDNNDFQRSPTQQYLPPSQSLGYKNSFTEYGTPKSKSSTSLSSTNGLPTTRISEEYGVPSARGHSKISQEYETPAFRDSPSEEYGVPSARGHSKTSQEYGAPASRNSLSEKYGVPEVRNTHLEYAAPSGRTVTQKYGASKSRNTLSQEYGLPKSRSGLSQEYGAPKLRSSLSQEYGVPSKESLQEYGAPSTRIFGQDYSKSTKRGSLSRNTEDPPGLYGLPHNGVEQSKPRSQYLPQKSRFNDVTKSFTPKSFSYDLSYGVPQLNSLSYEVPSLSSGYSAGFSDFGTRSSDYKAGSSKALSQEYGAPSTALKTDAVATSYSSARSPPSTYEAPSSRDAVPSEAYGVPEQYNARSSQGYEYGRPGNEDIQEPANYDFSYKVNDYITGSDFGHTESRQDNRAEGSYFVVLPDGTKQVVEYEADERGFKPRISVEPAEVRSGYDENAADLNASDGPY